MAASLMYEWVEGRYTRVHEPRLCIATTEPRCNLHCTHCYWSERPEEQLGISVVEGPEWRMKCEAAAREIVAKEMDVLFAGRIFNDRGRVFLGALKGAGFSKGIGLIDNGFTFRHLHDFCLDSGIKISYANISVDGWGEDHDLQRQMDGAFKKAKGVVEEFQEIAGSEGWPLIVASCLTKTTLPNWSKLAWWIRERKLLWSVAPVMITDVVARRGLAKGFCTEQEIREMWEVLIEDGARKAINIYNPAQLVFAPDCVRNAQWEIGRLHLSANLPNGSRVDYFPLSALQGECDFLWDGEIHSPFEYFSIPGNPPYPKDGTEEEKLSFFNALCKEERDLLNFLIL